MSLNRWHVARRHSVYRLAGDSSVAGHPAVAGRLAAAIALSDDRRVRVARWLFALMVGAVAVSMASPLFAQAPAAAPAAAAPAANPAGYLSDKLNPQLLSRQVVLQMEQARKEGISKADFSDKWEKFAAFDAYYRKYVLGKFRDAEFLGDLGTLTQSLLEDNERAARVGAPAAPYINRYILEIAAGISTKNYHPAARVNATLLLALLDDAPENPSTKTPPTPSASALKPLVQLYNNEGFPDGVRAAALYGIARHVSLGAIKNPQQKAFIVKAMKDLLQTPAPAGRSADAHAYLQRYAVDIVSQLENPNASADTTNTLVAISTKAENPNLIAAYAASKIGVLQPGKQKVNQPSQVLKTWAGRAADAVEGELKRIADMEKPKVVMQQPTMPQDQTAMSAGSGAGRGYEPSSGYGYTSPTMMTESMGSGMEYGSYGMPSDMMGMNGMPMPAKPQPPEVIASRRRINHVLQQFLVGATGKGEWSEAPKPAGLLTAINDAEKAEFEHWLKTVGDVVAKVNDETLDDRKKFVEALTEQAKLLRELSGVAVADPAHGGAAAGAAVMNGALGVDPLAPAALPGAAPAIPGAAPALPGAAPALPGAAPAIPAAAPSVPGAAPAIPAAAPAIPGAAPALPAAAPAIPAAAPAVPAAAPAIPAAVPAAAPAQ